MKRAITALAAAVLFVGCQQEESSKPTASIEASKHTKTADAAKTANASETAKTAGTVTPAGAGKYYEITKGGKMYVFSSADSLAAFMSGGKLPAATIEKPAFGPAGETVVFESGNGVEAGLMAEYAKSHPKK